MRSMNHPRPHLLVPALAGWLLMAGWVFAQTTPPVDGIQDETRALTDETHRQIAQELKLFREDLKCDAWITAASFTPAGVTVRRQAQTTRREWSGLRPAVLMAFERASNSSAMSFAPEFWERYPSTELVEIMQETRRILLDTKLTLDERLALATRCWIDRLRVMESVRLKQFSVNRTDSRAIMEQAGAAEEERTTATQPQAGASDVPALDMIAEGETTVQMQRPAGLRLYRQRPENGWRHEPWGQWQWRAEDVWWQRRWHCWRFHWCDGWAGSSWAW